jgi:hypothetical protein
MADGSLFLSSRQSAGSSGLPAQPRRSAPGLNPKGLARPYVNGWQASRQEWRERGAAPGRWPGG